MAAGQRQRAPRRDRSGAVVALLSGFLLTGAILAGVALLFPDLVEELDLGGEPESTTSTEPPIPETAEADVSATLDGLVAALGAGDLSSLRFAAETIDPNGAPANADATDGDGESEEATVTGTSTIVPEPDSPVGTASGAFDEIVADLGSYELTASVGDVAIVDSDSATAPIDLVWSFEGIQWATSSQVDIERVGDEWLVVWDPAILEPSLVVGDRLESRRTEAARAPILARDGSELVSTIAVVDIGVQPSRVEDVSSLTQALEGSLGIDGADLATRIGEASPDAFVPVATLPQAEYDLVQDEVFPLPGTVFRSTTRPVAVDPDLARALLGRSGEVTADIIEEFPNLFRAGDYAGLSGLQGLYNGELQGAPGFEINAVRAGIVQRTTTTGTGLITTSSVVERGQTETLFAVAAVDGQPVQLTIDPRLQQAAEDALERTALPSAFVAIQVSTGDILAMANGPRGSTVNFAATGQYPPGSIFKVVSGYALLRDRLDSRDRVECPQTIRVSGRSFANAENEVLGTVSFRDAFAHSCNTAFVGATLGFGPEILNQAGADFGLGDEYDLGIAAFGGSVPVTEDDVDLAAAAFGQGRVLVSPLSAAVMASTAADGTYRSPRLVVSPAPGPQVIEPLDQRAADELQELMRAVVTEGTGRVVAGVDGGPVAGKTGTAEFGNDNPPKSHAWFVGFQGDIAFAVLVEAGEFGGSTAAPIAAQFLNSIR